MWWCKKKQKFEKQHCAHIVFLNKLASHAQPVDVRRRKAVKHVTHTHMLFYPTCLDATGGLHSGTVDRRNIHPRPQMSMLHNARVTCHDEGADVSCPLVSTLGKWKQLWSLVVKLSRVSNLLSIYCMCGENGTCYAIDAVGSGSRGPGNRII